MGQNGYKADPAEIRDPMMMNSRFGSGIAAKPYQNNSTSECDDSGAVLHRYADRKRTLEGEIKNFDRDFQFWMILGTLLEIPNP